MIDISKESITTEDQFRILHSEIMMSFQCIEFNLKRIYAAMSSKDFGDEMDALELSNYGNTLRKLIDLDQSDGNPWLSDYDYEQLESVRGLRNYWAHQCYLDFVYIPDERQRAAAFQRVFNRLFNENNRVRKLSGNLERLYFRLFVD